jgi:hypothetical protein
MSVAAAPVNYEMNLRTLSGMGAGGVGSALGMMFGARGASFSKAMDLRLVNPEDIPADYEAAHTVPAPMGIGPRLPLKGERRGSVARSGERADSEADGRVLIYWGCSPTVAKGQPEIIDFKALSTRFSPEVAAALQRGRQRGAAGGSGGSGGEAESLPPRSLGWPAGDRDFRAIPVDASAVGEHLVNASFMTQEIRFTLGRELDFLEPMNLKTSAATTRQAIPLSWDALTRARGYDLTAVGARSEKEMVMWLAAKGKTPMLPGSQHECTIPDGIFAQSGDAQMVMVSAIVHGPTQGFAYPPQKPGEKKPLIWTARVRVIGMDSVVVGMGDAAAGAAAEHENSSAPAVGVGTVIKGLFGF